MSRLGAAGILVWLAAGALHAQNSPTLTAPEYRIEDRGQSRVFEVARDEIHVRPAADSPVRQLVRVPATATAEGIRTAAKARATALGGEAGLVLYETGKPRSAATRRFLTREILVRLRPNADPQRIAETSGLISRGPAVPGSEYQIFEAKETGGALEAARALRGRAEVITAEPQLARQQQKRFVPDDTYFPQQWHLLNTGQGGGLAGADANVSGPWENFRGAGIRIGIVDDGLQLTHPDLAGNIDTENDRDWNDSTTSDPSPVLTGDFHGTACAGVAAARGGNSIGVTGAAPEATLVGLRLIAEPTTDLQESEAMLWKSDIIAIKSNSWGPPDNGTTLEAPGPLTRTALANAVANGRGGLGTIFVWAGGNGGGAGDNSNYDGYANAPETIAVGAISNVGKRPSYSEPGANLVVSAPSSGGTLDIVTTDLIGNSGYNSSLQSGELSNRDYTNDFGGTSAATPLVAGCVALMLEANPTLGWRDVQEILMRSARKVDPSNPDWTTNTAGFQFNHNFGAGMVDAQAAVALAQSWTNLATRTSVSESRTGLNVTIPDNNATGAKLEFDLSAANLRSEHVTVRISVTHTSRGQLAITLTSPTGTQSRLAERRSDTGDNYSEWTFSTVRNWGEDSQGVWRLTIADLITGTSGRITGATLTVYGTPAGPLNRPPSITSAQLSHSGTIFEDQPVQVSQVTATDPDGDPITLAYQWEESADNVAFTPIPGATGSSLVPAGSVGRIVRCLVTPSAAGKFGLGFLTISVPVNRRPPSLGRHGEPYSYDPDLFLFSPQANATRTLIINEFSQGPSGSREWVELLVLHRSDLRGFKLSDRIGTYVTFANAALWSNVPAGTVIVIYNGNDRDSSLPSDRQDLANGLVVVSHANTSLFTGTWGGINNSGNENLVITDASGTVVDGLSINSDTTYDAKLGNVGSQRSASYQSDTDAGAEVATNWKIASYLSATPGAGNSSLNSAFVSALRSGSASGVPKYRLAPTSDLVPGLTINEMTGVLNGTPDLPAGGLFRITIERRISNETVTQTFDLLIAGQDGNGIVPAGKTWTLSSDVDIPGDLTVLGAIDTAGRTLGITGRLIANDVSSLINPSGLISFGSYDGEALPGSYTLAADPINDLADPDGDLVPTLVEFALGFQPGSPDLPQPLATAMMGGRPHYTVSFPAGAVGVTRTIEVSSDLVTWHSGAPHVEVVSDSVSPSGTRTITVRDLSGGATSFGRVRVSR